MRPLLIISGGQTGVDRAALDAALEMGIPIAGWCPKGRRAEDGPIDNRYTLTETPMEASTQRTVWNVQRSDGTLVIGTAVSPGTNLAIQTARQMDKPLMVHGTESPKAISDIRAWLKLYDIRTLNVAGPRESESPGIYDRAFRCFRKLLSGAID